VNTRTALSLAICALLSASARSQPDLAKIKADYLAVSTQVNKHLASDGMFLDDDAQSPGLLAKQWSLSADWLAASLDARSLVSPDDVKSAMLELAPSKKPDFIALDPTTFVVATPGEFGNFFIVTRKDGHYRVAWNIANPLPVHGKQAQVLAAWRPENARDQRRDVLTAGPVEAGLSSLPPDAKGRPRFYLDGTYSEPAGIVVPAQISIWVWDGSKAQPLFARRYGVDIEQDVGTRLEGSLLKVRDQGYFRTFSASCDCEVRPFDWTLRIAPVGVEDLGEKSLVPELDAVDELYDRLIHGKPTGEIASPEAIKVAKAVLRDARKSQTAKEWNESPGIGMLAASHMDQDKGVLCMDVDELGAYLYALRRSAGRFFIKGITKTDKDCGN
jgi:hypothetical protein